MLKKVPLKLNFLRHGSRYQIGWIFGKVPKFQSWPPHPTPQYGPYLWKSCACILYYLAIIPPRIHATISIIKDCNIIFLKMRGGRRLFENFSNNSSDLVQPPFPIQRDAKSQNPDWEHWIICLQSTGILMEPHFMLCQVLPDYFGRPTALRCLPSLIHAYLASLWLLVLCWRGPRLTYCIKTNVVVTY